MKTIIKYLLAANIAMAATFTSHAQSITTDNGVGVNDINMQKGATRLNVDMIFDISNLKVRSNRSLRITPVVSDGNEMIQLPAVVVEGRRRNMIYRRDKNSELSNDFHVRRYNNKEQTFEYDYDIAFEPWMNNSELILREEWCECHDLPISEEFVTIAELSQPQQPSSPTPQASMASATTVGTPKMAYAMPKTQSGSNAIQTLPGILFRVNSSTIEPSFMDNARAIATMHEMLAAHGKNIDAIHLMGYASPEGPYKFNETLAAKRAEAIKNHIATQMPDLAAKISTNSSPANWDAVKKMLNESYISNYLKIIAIIDDNSIAPAEKNNAIRRQYPVEYQFMLDTWYPKLRVTDIAIDAPAPQKSVAEIKQKINTNPSDLPLEDIYLVALTYEKGSKEWNEIMIIAVETYPQSPEARVNAANVAMANGNYAQAAAYLQGLPADMPEAMNSRGILAMSEGDYSKAMALFQQAEKAGVSEAAYNISLLKQLMSLAQ
jgi:outer membrane protein OmpA-like peptidoglycan-associated protein